MFVVWMLNCAISHVFWPCSLFNLIFSINSNDMMFMLCMDGMLNDAILKTRACAASNYTFVFLSFLIQGMYDSPCNLMMMK